MVWQHPAPFAKCFFLDQEVIDLKFQTLVVRDFPILPRSIIHFPGSFNPAERNPDKLIAVIPNETNVTSRSDG